MMACLYGMVTTPPANVGARKRETTSLMVGHSWLMNVQGRERDLAMWLCIGRAMEWVTCTPAR